MGRNAPSWFSLPLPMRPADNALTGPGQSLHRKPLMHKGGAQFSGASARGGTVCA